MLWRLLHHKDVDNFAFKTIVRDAKKAAIFKDHLGIDAIVGSHKDEGLLESLASEADYVFAIVCIRFCLYHHRTLIRMRRLSGRLR